MPKFIGNSIEGSHRIDMDNASCECVATAIGEPVVRLSFAQARLLPPNKVYRSMDTTDKGSRETLAKRWWRWFATSSAVLACDRATPLMRKRAVAIATPVVSGSQP